VTTLLVFHQIILTALSFDPYATPVILGLYIVFMIIGSYRVFTISRSINQLSIGILDPKFKIHPEALKFHLFSNVSIMEYLAESPLSVGILGTVLGLLFMVFGLTELLNGIDNATEALSVFGQFIKGSLIAFVSTAVGIIAQRLLEFLMVFVRNGVGVQYQLILELQDIDAKSI